MKRKIIVDTSVFEKIAQGDIHALVEENERFRRAVVDNDDAAKLDNKDADSSRDQQEQTDGRPE